MTPYYIIRFVGLAGMHTGPGAVPEPGQYLVEADVEAHDGRGAATWSTDPDEAKHFANAGDAFTYWRQQSTLRPLRDDGKPNRPLTSCSVEVTKLGDIPVA
jgi:hypothetical protein